MAMDGATWAVVGATIVGPLAAVLITRWRDRVTERRGRRVDVFRTLMATRRVTINVDHVRALNVIEVEFYGVKPIEAAWKAYIAHLSNYPPDRRLNQAEQKVWDDTRADLLAKLLFAIAQYLGYRISELDIRNGGYVPDAWRYRDDRLGTMQEYVIQLATGKAALPIAPWQQQQGEDQHQVGRVG